MDLGVADEREMAERRNQAALGELEAVICDPERLAEAYVEVYKSL